MRHSTTPVPCPICRSTEHLVENEYAKTTLDQKAWICERLSCIYERTRAKSERMKELTRAKDPEPIVEPVSGRPALIGRWNTRVSADPPV